MSLASSLARWCFIRPGIALGLLAVCVLFCNLGAAQLFDEDEPKNAACGAEMFARGDWITPTFNEDLRTDKPILVYWLMLTSYHVFGVSEFSARFWSAVLGVGTLLLTVNIGATLFNKRMGFWAGAALLASPLFVMISRAATPEATLTFCATLATWCFVQAHRGYW
ncbi:MAG TPA: glycosyltransferase family 39 protein, partial [Pirellulales bacterium]